MHTSTEFILHGGDTAFANRQKALFDQLSNAEKECNKNKVDPPCADMNVDNDDRKKSKSVQKSSQTRKSVTKRFRGKESIFKRPEGPAPRANIRSIPDHRRNPHKWTKYSLDDVSNDDMTDRSNTHAALSFLKELKARKLRERSSKVQEKMDLDETELSEEDGNMVAFRTRKVKASSQIEFKRPKPDIEDAEIGSPIIDDNNKPIFRSSKIIMPEYVVGEKQKKKNRDKHTIKVDHSKQLKLDHLQELDEDED